MFEQKVNINIFSAFRFITGKFERNLGYPNCKEDNNNYEEENVDIKDCINRKISYSQETVLHYYARNDQLHEHKEKIKFLLQYRADINSQDSFLKLHSIKRLLQVIAKSWSCYLRAMRM